MNTQENPFPDHPTTLAAWLAKLRKQRENKYDLFSRSEQGMRYISRLELIEHFFPNWLDMPANHPLYDAITNWAGSKFAVLIGRAIVYPRDYLGLDPKLSQEELLMIAMRGLAGDVGRPKLTDKQQENIYDFWSFAEVPQQVLAEMYGVSLSTIERVIKKWKRKKGEYR